MTRAEYERHKQRLDEELRAGMEMLAAAHRYQLRALEMVWAVTGEEGAAITPSVLAPAVPETVAAPSPAPPPQKPRRHKSGELLEAVRTALTQLPETFNRNDVCAALGYDPDRGSLYRVLQELQAEGTLAMKSRGDGNVPTIYKKTGR
jgi:hypothetical protein